MATKSYRGDAPAVAKVVTIPRPVAYTHGAITLVINNKKVRVESWDSAALVEAWNESGHPETVNVFASAGEDEEGNYGTSFAPVILTSLVPGEDFFVDVYIGDEGSVNITNETQKLVFSPEPTGGTFTLTFSGQTTGAITYVADNLGQTAANILAGLNALSNIAPGDVVITPIDASNFYISFAATYVNTNVPLITAANIDLVCAVDGTTTVETVQAGVLPVDEVQILSITNAPTGGTFTLTYAGQTTAGIAYNANAATVQAALEALSNIAVGDVVCSGGALPGTPVTITFAQALGDQDVALITGNGASLTGGTSNVTSISTTRAGSTPTNSKTRFYYNVSPVGRTAYWDVNPSVTFAYNASLATIKAALVGATIQLRNGYNYSSVPSQPYVIQTGDITITGDLSIQGPAGGIIVEFTGNLAGRTINLDLEDSAGPNVGASDVLPDSLVQSAVETFEIQQYVVTDPTETGTYTLTVYDSGGSPHTTEPINYSESDPVLIAQIINAALGGNYVAVGISGVSPSAITVVVQYLANGYQSVNITQLSANEGSGVSVIESVKGSPGTSEVQELSVAVDVSTPVNGGTFTITYDGQTTSALAYNATASTIQAALIALSNLAAADLVSVSGTLSDGIIVVFDELLGNVNPMSLNIDSLTAEADVDVEEYQTGGLEIFALETTRNQGPECFDDPLNYDPVGVPSDSDDVNFEYGRAACRWGIKQRDTFTVLSTSTELLQLSSKRPLFQNDQKVYLTTTNTVPGGLTVDTAYYIINMDERGRFQLSTSEGGTPINITSSGTGTHTLGLRLGVLKKPARYEFDIGLPRQNSNGFIEYRPRYLEVHASQVILGEGNGNDSNLTRIDTGTVAISSGVQVYGTGSSNESSVPALAMLLSNNTVDIKCYGGDVGLAPHLDEAVTVRDLELYDTQLSSVGQVTCRNVAGDEGSSLRGKFVASGTIKLGV